MDSAGAQGSLGKEVACRHCPTSKVTDASQGPLRPALRERLRLPNAALQPFERGPLFLHVCALPSTPSGALNHTFSL